jgi:SAM-dependent methyltransferase
MLAVSALRCVACGSGGLQSGEDVLDCPACGRAYPVLAEVPVMFSDAGVLRGPLLEPTVARTVLEAMDLPPDPISVLRVRRASRVRARFGDRLIGVESAQFLRRVHASGFPIPEDMLQPVAVAAPEEPDGQPCCRWITNYIPRVIPPGHAFLANIRFENTGTAVMRQAGEGRITIAFRWLDEAGAPVTVDDIRTPLPLDLPPGRALTLPISLLAPESPGRYGLVIKMVMEGVRWLQPDLGPIHVAVREGAGFVPPWHWDINSNKPAGYLADQERGFGLMRDWLQRHPAAPGLRLLEIGGNAKPMLGRVAGEAYNVDVDLLGLQVGCIVRRARGNFVTIVCADAQNLPFAEGFFDAIVMFASLHHFPDPAATLRTLRRHLRPGGFIGLFCEPVGQVWPGAVDPAFTEELHHGVNEQGFSLAEYAQIFRDARLDASEVVVDHNSLKAYLVPVTDRE